MPAATVLRASNMVVTSIVVTKAMVVVMHRMHREAAALGRGHTCPRIGKEITSVLCSIWNEPYALGALDSTHNYQMS